MTRRRFALIFVIAPIVLLALAPFAFAFFNAFVESRDGKTMATMAQWGAAIDHFHAAYHDYPTSDWLMRSSLPKRDGWGRRLMYTKQQGHYVLQNRRGTIVFADGTFAKFPDYGL